MEVVPVSRRGESVGLQFQRIFENAPALFLLLDTDPDFTILGASDAYLRATYTRRQTIVGRPLFEVFPDNPEEPGASGTANLRASLERVIAGRCTDTMAVQKYDIRRPESSRGGFEERYWSPVNSPVLSDKGDILCIVHRVEDVTEFKVAESELREARRELAQAARRATMAAMAAAIAQEVLQPLAAIVASAHAGLRWLGTMPPELGVVRDTFKDIVKDGHRASAVLQGVRAMFSGSNEARTLLDANDLVTETIALVNSDFEAAGVLVQTELAGPLPQVHGHRGQLQQVILNIINNAADAMRTIDDRTRVLRVKSRTLKSNEVMISIEDTGPGIEPKNVDRIFDPFFTTKANGVGMGLAICRSIIEAHDGTLSVTPARIRFSGCVARAVTPYP
jgi:C4-dicarboxylate-specific signal transduction histidine kinase